MIETPNSVGKIKSSRRRKKREAMNQSAAFSGSGSLIDWILPVTLNWVFVTDCGRTKFATCGCHFNAFPVYDRLHELQQRNDICVFGDLTIDCLITGDALGPRPAHPRADRSLRPHHPYPRSSAEMGPNMANPVEVDGSPMALPQL